MPIEPLLAKFHVRLMAAATLAIGIATPGLAQDKGAETKLGEDPFSVILRWRPTTTAPDMPDFVKKTRPAEEQLNYTPLTGEEPTRPKRLTPAELAATTGKLDAAAASARARAAAAFPAKKASRPATVD